MGGLKEAPEGGRVRRSATQTGAEGQRRSPHGYWIRPILVRLPAKQPPRSLHTALCLPADGFLGVDDREDRSLHPQLREMSLLKTIVDNSGQTAPLMPKWDNRQIAQRLV